MPANMDFWTRWNRRERRPENVPLESKTETAGYIPPKIQIEQMIAAGRRLDEARAEAFDGDESSVEALRADPTRSPGFDAADATVLQRETASRLQEQAAAARAAADAAAAAAAEAAAKAAGAGGASK